MMIGGGGERICARADHGTGARADHGIGITETDAASFVEEWGFQNEYDFGNVADTRWAPALSYSLNLWIR